MSDLLEIQDLVVKYSGRRRGQEFTAVDGVSLSVRASEVVGLVGESGSGKSTVGRSVVGLAPISGGSIRFEGAPVDNGTTRGRRNLAKDIQVVFQDPYSSLNPAMSIEEILCEPLRASGTSQADANARVALLLDQVGLPKDSLERRAREFSGGQRQRIAIARALSVEPRLIIFDEPVSALDLTTQAVVLDLMLEIQKNTGVAYLFISHDLAVVRYMCHRIAVMKSGRIVEFGTTDQVINHPGDDYTRRLHLATPVADPALQRQRRAKRLELAGQ
jgi:ABC-type glutathione transport system ATPase component